MSKQSNLNTNVKPVQAFENETITSVSNPISLAELTASVEALNLETSENATVVHHTQVDSSTRARETTKSPSRLDQRKNLSKSKPPT